MALFFSGFVFFRNLLAPSESGLSFRKTRIEKIDLIRLFLWEGKRQDLTPCSSTPCSSFLSRFTRLLLTRRGPGSKRQDLARFPRLLFGNGGQRRFTCQFLSVILPSLFVLLTLNTTLASASPPTHYFADPRIFYPGPFGETPDLAAQAAVNRWNSFYAGSSRMENLRTCSVYTPMPGYASYLCPYDWCTTYPTGTTCTYSPSGIEVWPRCGPSYGAPWNGTEFYCPPEPECPSP